MTWSYSGNPSSSDLDAVRYLIGDTNSAKPLLSNEEIQYDLSRSNVFGAAALSCNAVVAKLSRLADTYLDRDIRVSLSQTVKQYQSLAKNLEYKARLSTALPFCAATSVSEKTKYEENEDRVKPKFTVNADEFI